MLETKKKRLLNTKAAAEISKIKHNKRTNVQGFFVLFFYLVYTIKTIEIVTNSIKWDIARKGEK